MRPSQSKPSLGTEEVHEQPKFETLLADLSARFVNLPAEQVDRQIEEALREICECLGLDHSALWQSSASEPGVNFLTHLHRHPGMPPVPDRVDGDTYFPWVQQKIIRKEIVCVPSTVDAPPEAATDKKSWETYGIKSVLAIPLWAGDGPVLGVLAFAATREERNWPEALVKRFHLVAEVFANALTRKRTEQVLRESEARLRLAAASANAGL
jgi:formate hydrogenlyase transcriptional activator